MGGSGGEAMAAATAAWPLQLRQWLRAASERARANGRRGRNVLQRCEARAGLREADDELAVAMERHLELVHAPRVDGSNGEALRRRTSPFARDVPYVPIRSHVRSWLERAAHSNVFKELVKVLQAHEEHSVVRVDVPHVVPLLRRDVLPPHVAVSPVAGVLPTMAVGCAA